jgi:hypothetical protein
MHTRAGVYRLVTAQRFWLSESWPNARFLTVSEIISAKRDDRTAGQPLSVTISVSYNSVSADATTGNFSNITFTPSAAFTGSITLTAKITSDPTGAIDKPTYTFSHPV